MLNKIVSILTIITLLSGQAFSQTKGLELEIKINDLMSKVSEGIEKDELMKDTNEIVDSAKKENIEKTEFVRILADQLDLGLSDAEIEETVADVEADSSEERIEELANTIANSSEEPRLIFAAILLLFVIMVYLP